VIGIQEIKKTVFGVEVSKQCLIFYLFVGCSILPSRLRKCAVLISNKQQLDETHTERDANLHTTLGAGQEQYSIRDKYTFHATKYLIVIKPLHLITHICALSNIYR